MHKILFIGINALLSLTITNYVFSPFFFCKHFRTFNEAPSIADVPPILH